MTPGSTAFPGRSLDSGGTVARARDILGSFPLLPFGVLFTIGLAATLYRIGSRSIWYDEALSVSYAQGSITELWDVIRLREANGALYHAFLWCWVHVLGIGEAVVRAPSAAFAALTSVVVWWIGSRLGGAFVGWLAALLLTGQGLFVHYGQEARNYALTMLLAAVASALLLKASESTRRLAWLAYAAAVAAGIYAHLFITLVAAAHALWLVLSGRMSGRAVASFAIAGALAIPMFVLSALLSGPDWVGPLTGSSLRNFFVEWSSGLPALTVIALVTVWACISVVRRRDERLAFAVSWLLVPFAATIAISTARSFLVPRYLIVALPALALVLALVIVRIPAGAARLALTLTVAAVTIIGAIGWYTRPPADDFRAALLYIASHSRARDTVVIYPGRVKVAFFYYEDRLGIRLPSTSPSRAPAFPFRRSSRAFADSVWLALNYDWTGQTPVDLATLIADVERTHRPCGKVVPYGNVKLWRFVPRDAECTRPPRTADAPSTRPGVAGTADILPA